MKLMISLVVAVAAAATAEAQSCDQFMGQTVAPVSFDAATAGLGKLTPKGEFETTAQFEARRAASAGSIRGPLIIEKAPEDRKYLEYDADAQVLRLKSYAFHNTDLGTWNMLYAAGYNRKIPASTSSNIDVAISSIDKVVGSHEAQNAYGAKAQIAEIERTIKGIFEREASFTDRDLFPAAKDSPYVVGAIPLTPAEAMALKPTMRLAFVVVPKEPFLITGTHKVGKTTIANPREITERFSLLIADIQCGLALDRGGKVLGAYPTQ